MSKVRSANKEISAPVAIGSGIITAFIITLLLAATAGIFIKNEYFEIGLVSILAVLVQGVSVFLGVLIGGSLASERKVLSSIFVAGSYYLLLLCIAFLFYEGATGSAIIGFGMCGAATFAAIMLNTRGKKRVVTVRKRRRHS